MRSTIINVIGVTAQNISGIRKSIQDQQYVEFNLDDFPRELFKEIQTVAECEGLSSEECNFCLRVCGSTVWQLRIGRGVKVEIFSLDLSSKRINAEDNTLIFYHSLFNYIRDIKEEMGWN